MEREGQQREGALRAARVPPIAAAAFEARSGMVSGEDAERPATCTSCPPRSSALPVAQAACWPVAGAKLGGAAGSAGCPWALGAPVGRYEVKTRTVIWPCSLTGANSDMSGQLIAHVPPPRLRCREGTVSAGTAGRPATRSPPTSGWPMRRRASDHVEAGNFARVQHEPEDGMLGTDQAARRCSATR